MICFPSAAKADLSAATCEAGEAYLLLSHPQGTTRGASPFAGYADALGLADSTIAKPRKPFSPAVPALPSWSTKAGIRVRDKDSFRRRTAIATIVHSPEMLVSLGAMRDETREIDKGKSYRRALRRRDVWCKGVHCKMGCQRLPIVACCCINSGRAATVHLSWWQRRRR